MAQVFEGFTVVELADRRNQFIGKLLADSGARVIQVEPVTGSPGRWIGPFVDDQEDPNRCLDYWFYNTSKESIAVDITRKPGQDLVRRLLESADIFVESTKPGTLREFGLDHESVAALNPGLIYTSITDFGQDGPWAMYEMTDAAHLALGGPMGSSGYSDPHETPIGGQRNHAYNMSNVVTLHTITAALFERMTSGLGQMLDLSIHDIVGTSTESAVPNWLWYNAPYLRQTGQHAAPTYRPTTQVLCADGNYIQVSTPGLTNHTWVQLVNWMKEVGVAEDLADEKYNDDFYRATQLRHSNEIHAGIHRLLAKVPAHEAFIRGQGLGLAWAAVHAPEDNLDYEHYKQRAYWAPIEHEEIGKTILYPRGLYSNDDLGSMPKRRAPHLGEHTRAILTGDLGLTGSEVDALAATEVVR